MTSYILATVSLMAVLLSVVVRNTNSKLEEYVAVFFAAIFGFYISFFFLSDYFTGNGIDESVFYHLRYGLSGAGYTAYVELILLFCIAISAYLIVLVYGRQGDLGHRR